MEQYEFNQASAMTTLPHVSDAERSVLGSMLIDAGALEISLAGRGDRPGAARQPDRAGVDRFTTLVIPGLTRDPASRSRSDRGA